MLIASENQGHVKCFAPRSSGLDDDILCIGENCMAWRWFACKKCGGTGMTTAGVECSICHGKRLGYCGLAGRPEV